MNCLKPQLMVLFLFFVQSICAEIKPISPPNGMTMTQIAASFKANSNSGGPYYLEISKDPNFRLDVINRSTNVKGNNTGNVYFLFYEDASLLTPGTWYWRVAEKNKNNWSQVMSVKIETSLPAIEPKRQINHKNPIFHARLRSSIGLESDALSRLKSIIPDDLKENFVLDHPTTFPHLLKGNTVIKYYEKINKLGYPFIMDIGRPDGFNHENQGDRAVTLSEVEYVLQNFDNCIGIASGELFYEYFNSGYTREFNDAAMDLCAKYGRYYFHSDMNWRYNKWSMFGELNYDRFKQKKIGKYFVPLYKTTDPWGALTCTSAIQGMGLTGMVDNYGIWSDAWLWDHKKFGHPGQYANGNVNYFPYMFNMKAFLWSISQGGTVTGLEPAVAWGESGVPNENHSKYLIPFIRGVLKHNIMINKEAIKKATKVIIKLDVDPFTEVIDYKNDKYGNFYRSTYGLWDGGKDPSREEIIPNTSRYLGIPFLPHKNASTPSGMKLINLSQVQTKQDAESKINSLYPANNNEAYTVDLDNTIIVLNTFENQDKKQSYNISLGTNGILKMGGDIHLMSYIMGKREIEKKQYWFQVNAQTKGNSLGGKYNLSEYPTIITFTCSKRPTLKSDQMSAFIRQDWDEA
ncbi:glycoside hydrolase family 98 domain-containing protein, partial [Aquimarina aggregata]